VGIKRKKLKVGDLVVAKGHTEGSFGRAPIGLVVALYHGSHVGVRWITENPSFAYLTVHFQIQYNQTGFPANVVVDHWISRKLLRRINRRQP